MDVPLKAINFGGASRGEREKLRFKNKGSEMYWSLREELREGHLRLPFSQDSAGSPSSATPSREMRKLWAQIMQIDFEYESDRAIRVYKQGLDKRSPSPDYADALVLALEAGERGTYAHLGVFL